MYQKRPPDLTRMRGGKLTRANMMLERDLKEAYEKHLVRTANIDWSYEALIPWDRLRHFKLDPRHPSQASISPELAVAVETALLTEVNLPWFTAGLMNIFRGSLEVLQDFVRTWTSEEDQHSTILETYLLVTRNDDPKRLHHLRKTVVRNAWTPGEATPFEGMAYTLVQELATQRFYLNVAQKAQDEKDLFLANILRTVAKDESLHYGFYLAAIQAHLKAYPNLVWPLCEVFQHFQMPGFLMPNFAERQLIIAEGTNYGIADYYDQVISKIVKLLGIKDMHPTYARDREALRNLNRYLDAVARISKSHAKTFSSKEGLREAAVKLLTQPYSEILSFDPNAPKGQLSGYNPALR